MAAPEPQTSDAMAVGELWRYPVKSMAGERLPRTAIGPSGVEGDRVLYVVDARGRMLSARTKPRLLAHHATLADDGRVLVDGVDWEHPETASRVEAAAGPGAHLVRAAGPERFDVLPLLVVTDGALAELGRDHRRLRPNVVVTGVAGLAERRWEQSLLAVGDAVIALADLRGRCVMTTFDPDTVAQDAGVLRDINARFDGTFALNAWAGRSGTIAVGDAVRRLDGPLRLERPLTGRYA